MNVEKSQKHNCASYLYCVRVSSVDGYYSFGAPFLARNDQQACELVRQSLAGEELEYERGDLLRIGEFSVLHETETHPMSKRGLKCAGVVCNCAALMQQVRKVKQ